MTQTFPWNNIARFNFTWAIPGGAWIETGPYLSSEGMKTHIEWCSVTQLDKHMGKGWFERQCKAQGWMTGCWINVV